MMLDVRDTEQIWCVAQIKKVVVYEKGPHALLIHYEVSLIVKM